MESSHLICCAIFLCLLIAILIISIDTLKKVNDLKSGKTKLIAKSYGPLACSSGSCEGCRTQQFNDPITLKQCQSNPQGLCAECCDDMSKSKPGWDAPCNGKSGQDLANCMLTCQGY